MISNQYQNQPNFQGNLLVEGIKFPKKKLNKVAEIYAKRSKGMPDMTLKGILHNSDFDGRFFHNTHAIINGEDAASMVTSSFIAMFSELSPSKMANELVNVTKRFISQKQDAILISEICSLQRKIQNIRKKIQFTSSPLHAKRLKVIAESMEANLAKKEQKYAKLQLESKEISGEWCM